jgi:hypothetical protein
MFRQTLPTMRWPNQSGEYRSDFSENSIQVDYYWRPKYRVSNNSILFIIL